MPFVDDHHHHLRSNRSAALLQLSKVTKALQDAETCIKLKPDWEKGYFRKGSALEHMKKTEEVGRRSQPPHAPRPLERTHACVRVAERGSLTLFPTHHFAGATAQALDAYKEAAEYNPNSVDVTNKVKSLTRLVQRQKRLAEKEAAKAAAA